MIIKFYETPLDSSYKNVIDFVQQKGDNGIYNYYEILIQFMDRNYKKEEIEAERRSIKKSVDLTSLTIPYSYSNFRRYNYCIIIDRDNREYKFYFIEGIVSNNENADNPSVTLSLKWDVWNNNLDRISNPIQSVTDNTILCKHFDRFDIDNNEIIPKFYNNIQVQNPYTSNSTEVLGQRYIPLFLVLQLKEFPELNEETYDLFKTLNIVWDLDDEKEYIIDTVIGDSVNNNYNRRLIYIVAGLFDTLLEEYVDKFTISSNVEFSAPMVTGDTHTVKAITVQDYKSSTEFIIDTDLQSNLIENIYFSFNSPYKFTTTRNSIDFEDVSFLQFKKVNIGDNFTPFTYDENGNIDGGGDRFSVAILSRFSLKLGDIVTKHIFLDPFYCSNNRSFDIDNKNIKYSNKFIKSNFKNKGNNILGRVNVIEPALYSYPFDYLALHYNNYTKSIIPYGVEEGVYTVNMYNDTIQPQFDLTRGFIKVEPSTRIFIDMPPPLSYSKDALSSYTLRNGQQIASSRYLNDLSFAINGISGLINVGAGVASESVSGTLSGVKQIGNSAFKWYSARETLDAQLRDVKNTPDQWVPSMGECDVIYQDRLRLVHHYMSTENPAVKLYGKYFYKYGYEVESIGNVFENVRYQFDFCITKDCNLSNLLINSNDRITLENIFNRGVFKWHIILDNNGQIISSPDYMDINENTNSNIEHKFETDPVYRNWVNS